jgi:hypothetical protein
MPIDANLFAHMGTKPKGYGEFMNERLVNEGNALANQGSQLKLQQAQQAMADDNALRETAKGFGADTGANYNALLKRGLVPQAATYQKETLANQKAQAEAAKTKLDTFHAEAGTAMKIYQAATTPQALVQIVQQGVNSGAITPERGKAYFDGMPQDPAQFAAWREQELLAGMDVVKRIEVAARAERQAEDARHNLANEGLTRRGQDMTDARQRELAKIQRDNAAATKVEKVEERKVAANDKAVTKFSSDLQKEGVPEVEAALGAAEGIFSKYTDPKTGKAGNMPGIGRLTNVLPDWAVSDEGKDVRSSLSAVSNIVLSARSGAAVTDQELRRLARELQMSLGGDAAGMQKAYGKFRDRFEMVKANLAAGVSDEVKKEYEDRGGVKITRGGAKPTTPTDDPVAAALAKYK